jgi:hypothetical protein
MDKKSLSQGVAAASIGFGVLAALAPATMLKVYGADISPTARSMTRLWGTRNLLLGVLVLQAEGAALDTMLNAGLALNLVDSVLELVAPALDGSPGRTALQASATSALFGAVTGYAASLD